MQESQSGTIDPSLTMENVNEFSLKLTVNARFPRFQEPTSYNLTQNVLQTAFNGDKKKYDLATKNGGAIIFVQFTYDCNLDHVTSTKCKPSIKTSRLDDYNESEDGPQKG